VAKPNYSFEKRQRELAKKKKKEEKAAKKAQGGGGPELDPNSAAEALAGPVPDLPGGDKPPQP
jgi:hypothetical protein